MESSLKIQPILKLHCQQFFMFPKWTRNSQEGGGEREVINNLENPGLMDNPNPKIETEWSRCKIHI